MGKFKDSEQSSGLEVVRSRGYVRKELSRACKDPEARTNLASLRKAGELWGWSRVSQGAREVVRRPITQDLTGHCNKDFEFLF